MYSDEPFEPKIFERWYQDQNQLEELTTPICIMGVPDLLNLGGVCVNYLIEEMNAEKLVSFYYSDFDPITTVEEKTQIAELANIQFYIVKKFQGTRDFILITSNNMPKSPIGIHFLADKIAEFVSPSKPQIFISIATFPIAHPTQNRRSYLAYTSEELLEVFKINSKTNQNTSLRLQTLERGAVIGLNGLTVAYAKALYDVIGGILLSETLQTKKTDFLAAETVLKILNKIFNMQLSFESLRLDRIQPSEKDPEDSLSDEEHFNRVRKRIQT